MNVHQIVKAEGREKLSCVTLENDVDEELFGRLTGRRLLRARARGFPRPGVKQRRKIQNLEVY